MDLFNSEILSYRISEEPIPIAVMDGLKNAIWLTSDWAYQMKVYGQTLKQHKIFQSMSRKGIYLDNSPMENFFSLLKQEIYRS